jgi:hypothetical protein
MFIGPQGHPTDWLNRRPKGRHNLSLNFPLLSMDLYLQGKKAAEQNLGTRRNDISVD